ncbi:MAG TPA: branched-chain amino acid transaminase [Candidatus Aquilonibacter sp.]
MFPYVFLDGTFVALKDSRVGIGVNALHYGTGTFEGIRAFWNGEELAMLAAREHFQRLHRSARMLGMPLAFGVDDLVGIAVDLLQRNEVREDAYLRPLLLASTETLQVRLHDLEPSLSIAVSPMSLQYINLDGVRCIVSTWRRTPDVALPNRAKVTGGYIGPALAKSEALLAGADEAILLTIAGHVAEATTSNIFMRVAETWFTPPVQDDILEGITRAEMMCILRDDAQQVCERSIDRSELYAADEIFLCGTAALVVPVIEVDGRVVGNGTAGETTLHLQRTLLAIARGSNARYSGWRTPVPLPSIARR